MLSSALDKLWNKLPSWAQAALGVLAILFIVYGVARYGFSFLLKVILSP